MILAHWRSRRRLALLAGGTLAGREGDAVRAHVDSCVRCGRELRELRAVIGALEGDAASLDGPPVPASVLVERLERQLGRTMSAKPRPAAAVGWRLALPVAAALAVVLLAAQLLPRRGPEPVAPKPAPVAAVPAEVLERLERNMTREHTARYLSDAQDVLLVVATTGIDCDRADDRVDLGAASERSRELLTRRTLLVESRPEAVASARTVLDEVELALREVADLPSCVRRRDVDRLRREFDERQLSMRIRLMTRELEG